MESSHRVSISQPAMSAPSSPAESPSLLLPLPPVDEQSIAQPSSNSTNSPSNASAEIPIPSATPPMNESSESSNPNPLNVDNTAPLIENPQQYARNFIFANPVTVFLEQSRIGAIIFLVRFIFAIAQVVTGMTLFVLYQTQECSFIHKAWLLSYGLLLFFVTLFTPRYFCLRIMTTQGDELSTIRETIRSKLRNQVDSIFFIPFLLGNIALFQNHSCSVAIKTFVDTVVIINYCYHFSSLIFLALAVLFSPCLFWWYLRMVRREEERRRVENGATDELIDSIPIVTFVKRKLDESLVRRGSKDGGDVEQATGSPSLQLRRDETAGPSKLADTKPSSSNESPGKWMRTPPVEVDFSLSHPSASSTTPASSTSPLGRRKRRFRLLPAFFRGKDKTQPSTSVEDHESHGQSSSTAEKKFLELDDEDAVCCICLSPYEDGESLRQLNCRHHFHVKCIDDWLRLNAKCPLCIQSIKKENEAAQSASAEATSSVQR